MFDRKTIGYYILVGKTIDRSIDLTSGTIKYSNIHNHAEYNVKNMAGNDINATYNWWGTADETLIEQSIRDYYDDQNLGKVLYKPYLTSELLAAARVNIEHMYRGDLRVTIGVGDPYNPSWSKNVWTGQNGLGNLDLTVDVSEAVAYLPPSETNRWFLKVYDELPTVEEGRITEFSIWYGGQTYTCSDVPVHTFDASTIYVFIPSVVSAHVVIEHPARGDLLLDIGVGDPANPLWSSGVWWGKGGDKDNLDLTICPINPSIMLGYLPPSQTYRWFLKVYDRFSGNQGRITGFTIRYRDESFTSTDVPVPVNDLQTSYAYVPSIEKSDTTINFTFQPNPANPGETVNLLGTLKDENADPAYPAQVEVDYSVDGGTSWNHIWTLTVNATGEFSRSFIAPSAGEYLVKASYAGFGKYNPSSHTETLKVGVKVDTQVVFVLQPNPAKPAQAVTLSGTLRETDGDPVYPAQVKVEYSLNGISWNYIWMLNTNRIGIFSKTFTAPSPGEYFVRVTYAGSAKHSPSSHTEKLMVQAGVNIDTQIVFSLSPNPAKPSQTITLSGTLKDVYGNTVYPAQVRVDYSTDGGATWHYIWSLNTNSAGQFSKTFTAPRVGKYLVRVSYAGSAKYNLSSNTQTLVIQ